MTTRSPTIRCYTQGAVDDRIRAALLPLDATLQSAALEEREAPPADGVDLVLWHIAEVRATFPIELERLRADNPETPLIVLAEPAAEPLIAAALAYSVDWLLTTPGELRQLPSLARSLITARRLQTRLGAAEAELHLAQRAIAAVNDGLVLVDMRQPHRPIVYCNPAFSQITGYQAAEVMGRNCRFLQGADTDPAAIDAIRHALRDARPCHVELLNYRRDGTPFWNELSIAPVFDDDGALTHYIGTQRDITNQKEAEEALRESNERYNLAVSGSSDGIWDWKVIPDHAYFSPRFRALMGYAPEGYLGGIASLAAVVHPDDLERTTAAINAHLSQGTPYKVEYRLRLVSGEYRWFLVRGQAIWDSEGRPVRMAGSLTDIHDGKIAQQELEQLNRTLEARIAERTARLDEALRNLQESEHRLRTVVANAPIILFSFDSAGRITIAEGRGLAQLGLEPSLLSGQSILALNRDEPEMLTNIHRVLAGETLEAVYEMAGTIFETRYIPLYGSDGAVTGAISVSVDITAHRRAEKELAGSLKFAQSLTDTSPDIVYVYDLLAQRNVTSNRAIERILGYTPEEIYVMGNQLFSQLMHPDDLLALPAHSEALRQLPDGMVKELEYRMRAADGSWRWLLGREVIFQRLPDHTAHLTLGVVSDITQRKRTEQALHERSADLAQANTALAHAAQLKDEFLASMSHELRTPLNAILGHSELLQEGVYGPLTQKQGQSVAAIEESGRHLLALINDILDLSKIEASRLTLEPETVHVQELCQAAVRLVSQAAFEKGIRLSMALEQPTAQIEADPRRLKQILVNLLSNAVKFTPKGGRVSLTVQNSPDAEHIRFTVKDTGIGISPNDQARLFQPFVQIDSSLSRQHNGTGLGLALVMSLARLHNGSVTLESVAGEGSSFSVCLPVAQSSAALLPKPGGRDGGEPGLRLRAAPNGQHPLVLLVDDNPANIDVVKDYLLAAGYKVVVATNGLEAVACAVDMRPALILMDIQMPLIDGLEAIRRIRDSGDSATRIIALTALAMRGDQERCLAAGANAYITKPVSIRALLTLVAEQLGRAGHIA